MKSLFVYGTLVAPEVIQTLLGRLPKRSAARLEGFVRHPVKEQWFPGLISSSKHITKGVLYCDLMPQEMKRLDWFEDSEYERRDVTVCLEDGSQRQTQVYVWTNPHAELDLSQEWSYENFREQFLDWYLENTVRPCRRELDRLDGY